LFAGSFTNTPSLAGLLDAISNSPWSEEQIQVESERGVIGYSLSYPMGVLGVMIAIKVVQTLFRIDYQKEEELLSKEYPVKRKINSTTIEITKERAINKTIRDLKKEFEIDAVFGRVQFSNGKTELTGWDTKFSIGDQVAVVGSEKEIERVGAVLGKIMPYQLSFDRSEYDTRRIFVSNPKVAGQKLATLSLNERFSAVITRVRRGDIDLLANSNTVLELGDRVRFFARRKDVPNIAKFFGDSYDALSKINLLSFGLGMALGIWLGMITFQFPGDVSFKLGFAGGPLIVALILGGLRRTGPIVWTLPYSANLTLRQVGLILMLAGIGINSGHTFAATIFQVEGAYIFAAGTILAMVATLSTLIIGYKVLKIPFSFLLGMVASQPAVLDYAFDQTNNKLPSIGYTLVLPITLIGKIIIVQILFALL
jgi:putative transport protein